ncbi:MAG: DUF4374 domain-containing protein, partial [Bacteroidota bacterium]
MNKLKLLVLLIGLLVFTGCSDDDEVDMQDLGPSAFILNGIIDGAPTGANTVVVSDLTQGSVSVASAQEGIFEGAYIAEIDGRLFSTLQTVFGFTEYAVDEEGSVSEVDRVVAQASNGNIVDLGNNRVLTFNATYSPDGLVDYTIIDISNMTEVSTGQIEVEIDENTLLWPNSIIPKEDKLLLNYIYADASSFANINGVFTAVLNENTLEVEEIIQDDRSATPGFNLIEDHFFDSNGDLYISTTNSNYWGANESLPAGILRIRNGESEYDDDYFFNVTSQINGEHFVGLSQITDTKAIIKVFRSDLIEVYADHVNKAVLEHWVVDVQTQTATKLDIPLSLAPFSDPV